MSLDSAELATLRREFTGLVDEKPQIQLLGRPQPDIPARPGCPMRREHEHVRLGTGILLLANDVVAGEFFGKPLDRDRSPNFTETLHRHLATCPDAGKVHYVMDNGSTHDSKHTREWRESKGGRVKFHFTVTGASWLNTGEPALSVFGRKYLRGRVWQSPDQFPDHVELTGAFVTPVPPCLRAHGDGTLPPSECRACVGAAVMSDMSDGEGPRVSRATIRGALSALGLSRGHSVFVHGSLSRFGHVEGGAGAVCQAILDSVAPGGTVLMPAFTFDLRDVPNPVMDLEKTPSCVGLVSETFRTKFATHRSRHITHSVAAAGAKAGWFTSGHARDAFDEESAFRRLVDDEGYVLLLGVDYNSCTFFHAIEHALPVPYMGMTPKPGARVRLRTGEVVPADCSVHLPTRAYDFNRAAVMLDAEGLTRITACGNSILRLFPAKPVFERVLGELRGNPYALTREGEEAQRIAVQAR